jgi:hypothetical protein
MTRDISRLGPSCPRATGEQIKKGYLTFLTVPKRLRAHRRVNRGQLTLRQLEHITKIVD